MKINKGLLRVVRPAGIVMKTNPAEKASLFGGAQVFTGKDHICLIYYTTSKPAQSPREKKSERE